ncbi:TetR/AcrR family transcriptional regulator [Candidatus Aminicenantes bacterium AC-335-K20]|jgi:AcrR family transcriptional regulator|nr:TetR/AcrR family transcriptional regulator [SCandidatus Aminicenantes bacterium Aminicenantia_JdfR_composite]MCP2619160.1 TetR/AcrR family transcriptional regulator [Candidatus Aminicenantes bacterium AC-335-K20]
MNREERKQREELMKKGDILEAAKKLFAKKGFSLTTVDEIARESAFSKATIYHYFRSKGEIFMEIIRKEYEKFMEKLESIIKSEMGFEEKMKKIISHWLEAHDLNRNFISIFFSPEERQKIQREIGKNFMNLMIEERNKYRKLIGRIFLDGIKKGRLKKFDVNDLITALNGIIHAYAVRKIIEKDKSDLKEKTDTIYQIFLNGILAKEGRSEEKI